MKLIRWLLRGIAAFFALILLLLGISFLINRSLPTGSENPAQLSSAEKARLSEFIHLRQELGDKVWPGWGTAEIPTVLYNESHAFLVGYSDPPDGWIKVPQNDQRGGPWTAVPDDTFNGQPYYRQPLPASGETPQAFTVKIGNQWATSMTTMEWMEISLSNQFREEMLPPFLVPIFPYPLVTGLFIRGSDGYISLLAHESFHAYQGTVTEAHLAAAEIGISSAENIYPWADTEAAWQTELDLLAGALRAETEAETADLARQFLAQRTQRRENTLTTTSIVYERQREWLEGLARYVELEIWRQAFLVDYKSSAVIQDDPDFSDYDGFNTRWTQEIDQMRRMATDWGDGRFYYSGMAQAVLLDRLMPGWKDQALDEGIFLEDLLESAVAGSSG